MSAEFKEKTGAPAIEYIKEFSEFVDKELKEKGVSSGTTVKFRIAVDEIYSNICYYSGASEVTLGVRVTKNSEEKSRNVTLCFMDDGAPFDPLRRKDPAVTVPLGKRKKRGGLGIYMVKKIMDWVTYEYLNGKNCLALGLEESDNVE